MSLKPILLCEEKVQIEDKLRLDASKSFTPTGDTALATMTLKPEEAITAINIYNATVDSRYLDWAYDGLSWDIDATNNKIVFNEGGSNLTATIPAATYTRAALLAQIKIKMDLAGTKVYTVSETNDKITITATGQFKLLPLVGADNLLPHLSYFDTTEFSTSQVSERFEYCIKKLTLSVNNGGSAVAKSFYVKVYSEAGDALYSSDKDLLSMEPDILKYVPRGKASYLNVHRAAQENILDWLDQNGYRDDQDKRYRKFDILDKQEVKNWSKYMVLKTIFFGLHNSVEDVFKKKADYYEKLEVASRTRFTLSLDMDGDGEKALGGDEVENTWNGRILHR